MSKVKTVKFRTILNSKGSKTIECVVETGSVEARASAPSGTSAGSHEVVALPKQVELLVKQANSKLVPKLIGNDVNDQEKIDKLLYKLDDTANKSVFGGSVLTSCSLAVLKANALEQKKQVFEVFNSKP
ncbi:MAG: phosphopyruvate hydratase, partial [Candidatus Diapherotrites archaeon]|nr:phosphopyruvate hydratase [Candidatus Diapherotrites archaeon]